MAKNSYCGVGLACHYCKHFLRISNGVIYCKKHYGGRYNVCMAKEIKYCGKFKPKKNIKFVGDWKDE